MREKYENLLNEIEEISWDSYNIAEVLHGYCEYYSGEKVSSFLLSNFLKDIKYKQRKIINLIDERTTEIEYKNYLNSNIYK